ncbi:peptide ABC transporter substrate-binding protein [Anatilimnocola sp. NA78]|uniref:peptide ABC transporter substrate-binding protein n=1 Tax=Anatilimnocola sp. NA78 TaxID=3415683 RepID=UPI003CE53E0E
MPINFRQVFPYVMLLLVSAAVVWAVALSPLPPADFTFDNGTEVQTLDSAKATGNPENRMINGLFEGLLRSLPPADYREKYGPGENAPLTAQPGMAESYDVSTDGKTYTFHIRKNALWSDGSPVTAHDFAFSWQRMLHPETGSQYTYQLYYVRGTRKYTEAKLEPGDSVEVELADRKDKYQAWPRGTMVRGKLVEILKSSEPEIAGTVTPEDKSRQLADWKKSWTYVVDIDGKATPFSKEPGAALTYQDKIPEACMQVLSDWESTVGIKATDDHTLVVELNDRTPFFHELVAFYPLYPVNRRCIEKYGSPRWTKPENIVSNGPFNLKLRKLRDRIRLEKNPRYWDAKNVKLNSIDVLALRDETTALNMYLKGNVDWATTIPADMIPQLKRELKDEFPSAPMLTVYFYRLNTEKDALKDKRVRQALNLAIDKKNICEFVTKAGEVAAGTYVPPGLAGYESPPGITFDPQRARELLKEAGYAEGHQLPHIEILYNDSPSLHRTIAERVQQMWREHLGVDVQLRGLEWGVYLDAQDKKDYYIARAGWIADYPDPNTFLDMFVTGGDQNMTGWGNPHYDQLIADAGKEADPVKRMAIFKEAEALFLDELPIIPMYFYVSKNLIKPHVKGFCNDVQDLHPLTLLEIDRDAKTKGKPSGAAK